MSEKHFNPLLHFTQLDHLNQLSQNAKLLFLTFMEGTWVLSASL